MSNIKNNYNLPKTKKEKADLLKALLTGETVMDDLIENGIVIRINYNEEGKSNEQLMAEHEASGSTATFITLNL